MEKLDCVFCKIANGEIGSNIVFENDHVIAILDNNQVTRGHTLVMPKAHYDNFLTIDKDLMHEVMDVAQNIGIALMKNLLARGVNIIMNCFEAAGQSVMHFHVHVIPRYDVNDGLAIDMKRDSSIKNLPQIVGEIKVE